MKNQPIAKTVLLLLLLTIVVIAVSLLVDNFVSKSYAQWILWGFGVFVVVVAVVAGIAQIASYFRDQTTPGGHNTATETVKATLKTLPDARPIPSKTTEDEVHIQVKEAITYAPSASPFIHNAVENLNGINQDEWVRTIDALECSEDPDAAQTLKLTAAYHHTRHIRHKAAIAHVRHTKYHDINWPTMEDAALRGDQDVRQQTYDMLGNLGGHQAVEVLTEALQQEKEHLLRTSILRALGFTARKGDSYALKSLTEYYGRTTNSQEKKVIIESLSYFKTDDATQLLLSIAPDLQGEHLKAAISSLVQIDTENARNGLIDLILSAKNVNVQNQIIGYLVVDHSEF